MEILSKSTGDQLTADEWNQVPSELQNVITQLGQLLSSGDLNQVGKSIAGYVANGTFYTDSGAADAYVLSVIGSKQRAPAYTEGFEINFIAANPNTGPSTVNVAGLGVKDIKLSTGDDPAADAITGRVKCVFDSGNDRFELIDPGVSDSEKISLKSGRKNYVINGGFEFWQRGNNFDLSVIGDDYHADRWCSRDVGAATGTISRQEFSPGQSDVANNPRYFIRVDKTSAAEAPSLLHRIESVRSLSNRQVTLSFYAKASAAKVLDISLNQYFGTGGSPSTQVDTALGSVNLTTSWQRFEITVNLPSISGKTIGTNDDDYLEIEIDRNEVSAYTLDIANVQLEASAFATDFEYRSLAEELSLCQRYFEKSYNLDDSPGSITENGAFSFEAAGTASRFSPTYAAGKRGAPTVATYGPQTGTVGQSNPWTVATDVSCTAVASGQSAFTLFQTGAVDSTSYYVHWTADAEL